MVKETTASESEAIRVMKEKLCKLETTEGRRRGMEVRPELDGVLICTAPKCGTTWVQHIVHGIRSRGNLDFDEVRWRTNKAAILAESFLLIETLSFSSMIVADQNKL